ncbi:MAG: MlaD family protein [Imperialibacter sp.]|uniref:MlaD family protein n=1 Tax=Imperialibacter sp. TaxID=2038411 RepID=UPI0032EFD483
MRFSKEFKVGLFTIVSGALLYYGFNFLKGTDFFSNTSKYYALYETIDGLKVANSVIVNGYSVGRISRIRILQDRDNQVLVEMTIDEDIILTDSTRAKLYNVDFLGSKAIELSIDDVGMPIEDGDTLISEIDKGITDFLKESAAPVADNLGITIRRINEILLGLQGSGEKINSTIGELQVMAHQVNGIIGENKEELNNVMISFQELAAQLSQTIRRIDPILVNANGAIEKVNALELQATLDETQELLSHVNTTLDMFNKGEGTVGRLLKEDSIYSNLNKTIEDLDSLVVHINAYPKHFFAPLGKSRKKIEKDLARDKN